MWILIDENSVIYKVSNTSDNEGQLFVKDFPQDLIVSPSKYIFKNGIIDINPDYETNI